MAGSTVEYLDFEARARAVVEDYIRSVVLIDDDWDEAAILRKPTEGASQTSEIGEAESPSNVVQQEAELDDVDIVEDLPVEVVPGEGVDQKAPPKTKVDPANLLHIRESSIQRGIVFSGFRYKSSSQDTALKLAQRCDILVLDWNLLGIDDNGGEALALLDRMSKHRAGPRFVCIFTRDNNQSGIAAAISKRFGGPENIKPECFRVRDFTFIVRNKGDADTHKRLIDYAISKLVEQNSSLLALGLIELTTQHRQQLASVINDLAGPYDAALLVEHILAGPLSLTDVAGTIYEILFDEWRSHLRANSTERRVLTQEGLDAYLRKTSGPLPKLNEPPPERFAKRKKTEEEAATIATYDEHFKNELGTAIDDEELHKVFYKTINHHRGNLSSVLTNAKALQDFVGSAIPIGAGDKRSARKKNDRKELAYRILENSAQSDPEAGFLRLQSLICQRRRPPSKVTQGTLVKNETTNEYLLCVSPLCDAARLLNETGYLSFLRLQSAGLSNESVDNGTALVIRLPDNSVTVFAVLRPTLSLFFQAGSTALTDGELSQVYGAYSPQGEPMTFKFIAQLRRTHAFNVNHRAHQHGSRIGLNHVEYVRTKKLS